MNDVERGGLAVEKQDTITGSTPQGDADFSGITFQIINNSRNPVMVEGQKYQPGEVVKTLVTDSEGRPVRRMTCCPMASTSCMKAPPTKVCC